MNDEIVQLYQAGWSMQKIGDRLHWSRNAIRKRLLANRIEIRPRGLSGGRPISHGEQAKTIFLYRNMDLTMYEVAERLDLSPWTVRDRLQRAGVKRRSKSEVAALKRRRA